MGYPFSEEERAAASNLIAYMVAETYPQMSIVQRDWLTQDVITLANREEDILLAFVMVSKKRKLEGIKKLLEKIGLRED